MQRVFPTSRFTAVGHKMSWRVTYMEHIQYYCLKSQDPRAYIWQVSYPNRLLLIVFKLWHWGQKWSRQGVKCFIYCFCREHFKAYSCQIKMPKVFIFDMYQHLVVLYQVYSNCGSVVKKRRNPEGHRVMRLLSFFYPSSRCCGLVRIVRLLDLLIKLTFFTLAYLVNA